MSNGSVRPNEVAGRTAAFADIRAAPTGWPPISLPLSLHHLRVWHRSRTIRFSCLTSAHSRQAVVDGDLVILGAIGVYKLTSAVQSGSTLASSSEMKLKRFWNYEWDRYAAHFCNNPFCGEPYFQCDYTSRTCQRGYRLKLSTRGGAGFLYELLAEDRQTVIAHQLYVTWGQGPDFVWRLSFDTGMGGHPGPTGQLKFTLAEDMPESCLPNCDIRENLKDLQFQVMLRRRLASCARLISDKNLECVTDNFRVLIAKCADTLLQLTE